jgi:prophage regulatory protein
MVDRILRMRDVAAALGVTKPSVYALIRTCKFPKPISLGLRAVGWRESDINEWIRTQGSPAVWNKAEAPKVEAPKVEAPKARRKAARRVAAAA